MHDEIALSCRRRGIASGVRAGGRAIELSGPYHPDAVRVRPRGRYSARILAERLGEALGKPVVVENVTGAGGNIAADRLAKAAPDGYTIGVLAAANVVVNGSLYKKLAYDPIKDLAPITQVYGYPNVLVVNNTVPARTVAELVALARAAPGRMTYGHSGAGTSLHLGGELFNAMAHIDVQQVPFRGSSLVLSDLLGGRITMSFIPPTAALSIIRDGQVRALAVTSPQRAPFLPEVPTMEEWATRVSTCRAGSACSRPPEPPRP